MTDYPTREAIDAAADTIEALQLHLERSAPGFGAAWSGLETARQILTNLDAFPGLHYPDAEPEPESEPKPTAAEVLEAAWLKADDGSANESILYAALRYADTCHEWFDGADWSQPHEALSGASVRAYHAECIPGQYALIAASHVASDHPHLFGGAA